MRAPLPGLMGAPICSLVFEGRWRSSRRGAARGLILETLRGEEQRRPGLAWIDASIVQAVRGARDAQKAAAEDVGVDHRGLHAAVAEQLLNGANVGAVLEQVGRKGVTVMPTSA